VVAVPSLDTDEFNRFVAGLDFPMFVVTTSDGAQRAGCMVGFTTQASIDPPRFLVCLSVNNHTYQVAREAEVLAVHVLEPGQRDLAELFGGTSGDDVDKFRRCRWDEGPQRVPLLQDCPRRVVCRILEQHPFGDHVGFLLEPLGVAAGTKGQALTFQEVRNVEPGHRA
jgi:flavin reductase (DIM6/NTAB) family NADH-FMN oxidoreductase RutF